MAMSPNNNNNNNNAHQCFSMVDLTKHKHMVGCLAQDFGNDKAEL